MTRTEELFAPRVAYYEEEEEARRRRQEEMDRRFSGISRSLEELPERICNSIQVRCLLARCLSVAPALISLSLPVRRIRLMVAAGITRMSMSEIGVRGVVASVLRIAAMRGMIAGNACVAASASAIRPVSNGYESDGYPCGCAVVTG